MTFRGAILPARTRPSPYAGRAAERFHQAQSGPQHEREPEMAKTARKPPEDGGVIPSKDFAGAVRAYRHDIKPALSKVGEHNQEASSAYKHIKKVCHIQPQAAKLAFKLDDMEEAKRDDFLRCLTGLLKELNIPLAPADLVDVAEGKADAASPRGKPKLVTVPVSDGIDADLADPSGAEPKPGSTNDAMIKAMREDHARDKAEKDFDDPPLRREPVED